ncbi:MAG: prenyltransferase/squalene oxidase repeat-containing protein [Acidimicrobiales bacterium]
MRLTAAEVAATGAWIAEWQLDTGMIPWFPGGHADPWNHVEATMALARSGRRGDAERALRWLVSTQHADGSWCRYYLANGVEDPRRDVNVCAYVATGTWYVHLVTGDGSILEEMWPTIDRAMDFVLGLQQPGGEVLWSREADGTPAAFALLTGSSSVLHSLRCAIAAAAAQGLERPEWELAAGRLAHAVVHREEYFEPKDRWAMDWYYPVLCGALCGAGARERFQDRWDIFVMEGLGVRCVSDQPWVTAAETAECVMALDACGLRFEAETMLDWTRHFRDPEGGYWTGCVHPQCVRFPGGERTTYTAAAVLLSDHALYGNDAAAGLFRGETLPAALELPEVEERGLSERPGCY